MPQPDTSARYCDSSSYSGYVEDAVDWQGNKMYFRGFANLDAVPKTAFTVTIPAILSAKALLCIVPEARKAAVMQRALRDPVSEACPATIVRTQSHAKIFLDGASGGWLMAP